ncbi:MAG: thymidylate synthase [Nanoarchaeota archaeon]|nr:thymidylate synthase [Nanoarchaeota archaeon]
MKQYLDLLQDILEHGTDCEDRTGTGTRAVFGRQMRFSMANGFPAVTTKKLAWRSVVAELLWFLRGTGDVRELQKLECRIWDGNANAEYWKPHAKFDGDVGRIYGVQWRHWMGANGQEVDQIARLIETIQKKPSTRRHIVTAWNPAELDYDVQKNPQVALCPCHIFFQCFVAEDKLSLQMYQRSCDVFLGVPFNIASYSLLLHMIAAITKLEPHEFVHILGDTHIYKNHFEQVKEQLRRNPYPLPTLKLNPAFSHMETIADLDIYLNQIFKKADEIRKEHADEKEARKKIYELLDEVASLENYQCHPSIKAEMAI